MMETEPIWDIAHIAHVELFTPKPDESLDFFTQIMGISNAKKESEKRHDQQIG